MPTQTDFRKPPKQRRIEKDELQYFLSTDTITDFTQLTAKCYPSGFEFKKHEDYILIYRIVFDIETRFPSQKECICMIETFMPSSNVMETLYHYYNDLYMEIMLNLQNLAC